MPWGEVDSPQLGWSLKKTCSASVAFEFFQFVESQIISREDATIPIDSLRLSTIDNIFAFFCYLSLVTRCNIWTYKWCTDLWKKYIGLIQEHLIQKSLGDIRAHTIGLLPSYSSASVGAARKSKRTQKHVSRDKSASRDTKYFKGPLEGPATGDLQRGRCSRRNQRAESTDSQQKVPKFAKKG